jgi:hypothetical protein
MTDGPVAAKDIGKTEANTILVKAFVDDFLVNKRREKFASYISADMYTQHNPLIADGLAGLVAAAEAMAKSGISWNSEGEARSPAAADNIVGSASASENHRLHDPHVAAKVFRRLV